MSLHRITHPSAPFRPTSRSKAGRVGMQNATYDQICSKGCIDACAGTSSGVQRVWKQLCIYAVMYRVTIEAWGDRLASICSGAIGGRLDHTLSNLNSLYTHPGMPIVLVGDGNLVRLLPEGTSTIQVNEEAEGQHCGVVPLGGPVTVSSSGLKWDMGATLRQDLVLVELRREDGHWLNHSGMNRA